MTRDPENSSVQRLDRAATTFVDIVGTLVHEFDVIDVLTELTSRCVEILDAAAAGILLADNDGLLRVVGASTEQINTLELFQIQNDEGPCFDCYHAGEAVIIADLATTDRWPKFAVESLRAGFPSVCALPLRLEDVTLGCLNLFMTAPAGLSDADVAVAQALADVASIAMIQDEVARQAVLDRTTLQRTFDGRIAIEQAKGMIAETAGVDMDAAFTLLRTYARANGRGLTATAEAMVTGQLAATTVCS
ncbi:MAG: GAF and ANTAR domain-containing protein [Ilumatobacteraceae bacterium]